MSIEVSPKKIKIMSKFNLKFTIVWFLFVDATIFQIILYFFKQIFLKICFKTIFFYFIILQWSNVDKCEQNIIASAWISINFTS